MNTNMKKGNKKTLNKNHNKITACFFATIIIIQAMSGAINAYAYEVGRISIAETRGIYYGVNQISSNVSYNDEPEVIEDTVVIKKEAMGDSKAEKYDSSLEVVDKRTINSKTYILPDKTYVTDTYFEPIHIKQDDSYKEIDNTLTNSSDSRNTPVYVNKDGLYDFKIEEDNMLMMNKEGQNITISNIEANLNVYDVEGNVILYSEVYNNIDMEYRLHGNAVSTNFYINGITKVSEISITINRGSLKVQEVTDSLLFIDDSSNVVFSYTKPLMFDGNNDVHATTFSYVEDNDNIIVKFVFDTEWMNDEKRLFPIKMSTIIADESAQINVDTSYNREANPSQNSNYYHLFVGYENGLLSGGVFFGASRTYVHVSGMNLGPDKEIISANLKLYKIVSVLNQWNTIDIGKTGDYVKPSEATWNNRPSVSNISTTNVRDSEGWQEFDVKSYIEDIYNGKNNTIELKSSNENSAYNANVFSSESGTHMPMISVSYRDAYDVNPNLSIDAFHAEMYPFGLLDIGFEALSFDGIARPDSQVIFELVERGKDEAINSVTSKSNASKYFVDPIYITNHIANAQTYSEDEVNYTTDYIYKSGVPEFDKPYEYKVKVKNTHSTSTVDFRTDSFIKYKVKNGDNLKNLAAYYGISIEEIKQDNNLENSNIVKEDDVLILRFKKNNGKVTKDIYTPPIRTIEYTAKYVNRGPRCSYGICAVIDPVNSTTGNYYYEGIDFSIKDAEHFDFYRYYNSTGPQLSNMFGNGFTTPIESYITYDKDENILYFTGDGKIYEFRKTILGYEAKSQDKMQITASDGKITIKDLKTYQTFIFDEYGCLSSITSKEGVVTSISYDDYGLISQVKFGEKIITFEYNDIKLVKSITLPNGVMTSYKYDTNRNLIEYIDTKGKVKKYTYDSNNYLTTVTDKNGNISTHNTYDSQGRVLEQIDGNNNASKLAYSDFKTVIIYPNERVDQYNFNEQYDTLSIIQDGKVVSENTYDDNRNITSKTDGDNKVTRYTYDNRNNLTNAAYPDHTTEEYRYDINNNIIYQKDREGNITENRFNGDDLISTHNSKNENSSFVYDNKRRVIKETDQFGVSKSYTYAGNMIESINYSNGLIESFEYDANGNTVKEIDNHGKLATYVYNINNEMIQKNYHDNTNEKWVYDANGNISTYQDRIGGITNNTYDKNNNLVKSTSGDLMISKTYNEINQLISESDAQGLVKSYFYDAQENMNSEIDNYGNTTKYEYDVSKNVIKTIDVHGNEESSIYNGNNLISNTTREGLTTTYEYDSYNREIKKTNPNGTIETKLYKGLLLEEEKDNKDIKIEYFYDEFSRLIIISSTYKNGVVSVTQYTYDIYGNVVETSIDGIVTKNTYDVYRQLILTTDALGNSISKEYDFDGNVIKEIDALGNAIITNYDGNRNVISITDKNGNTERKQYNTLGQLVSETDKLGFVKIYTYNNKGQVIQVIDPYNKRITYEYDEFGNQIEVKLEDKILETKRFDSFGREVYVKNMDCETSTTYDDFHHIIEKTNELTGLINYTSYDKFGNIVKENDSEGLSTMYEYDNFNRRIKTTDPHARTEEITYDEQGRMIHTKSFDNTETSSKYDNKGNLVESKDALGKVTKNTYDALNRVVRKESGLNVTETIYDANGQIIELKYNNDTSTKSIYDKNGNVIEAIDVFNHSVKTEYDAKNQVISTIDPKGNRSRKEYDAYGNIIKETDELGHTKQRIFNAYGLVEKEVDERGFDVTYQYNDNLQISKITDSKGYTLLVEYNNKLQKTKEINAN